MPRSVFRPAFDVVVSAGGEIGSPDWRVRMDTARRQADYSRVKAKKGQKDHVIAWNGRLFLHFVTKEQREKYLRNIRVLQRDGLPLFIRRSNTNARRFRARDAVWVETKRAVAAKKQKRARGR